MGLSLKLDLLSQGVGRAIGIDWKVVKVVDEPGTEQQSLGTRSPFLIFCSSFAVPGLPGGRAEGGGEGCAKHCKTGLLQSGDSLIDNSS